MIKRFDNEGSRRKDRQVHRWVATRKESAAKAIKEAAMLKMRASIARGKEASLANEAAELLVQYAGLMYDLTDEIERYLDG